MSTVDVVIPCYNYARFLPKCVESALSQERVDVRVLIVDDCSPDNTAEVGQRLAAADSRVTYVRNDVNMGLSRTVNRGLLEWASAEYSLVLSADDALSPGALARATDLLDANPQAGMVYGLAIIFSDDEVLARAPETGSYETMMLPGGRFLEFCCESGDHVPTPTAVVRTKVQQDVGGYSTDFPHTSDFDMWMRFALRGDVGVIKTIQGYWRRHTSNMSSLMDRAGDLRECMRTVTKFTTDYASQIDDPERLLDIFRRRCATEALHEAHKHFDNGNAEGVGQYVAFAADHGVPLSELATWRTLRVKRMIGLGGYKAVRPVIEFLRAKGRPPAVTKAGAETPASQLFGRWPAFDPSAVARG